MYKVLNIGGKDYKLEYTIEASLYEDCVETMMNLFGSIAVASDPEKTMKGLKGENRERAEKGIATALKKQTFGIPKIALTLFYAGLMEHHGTGRFGDGTVLSKEDAKRVVYQYFDEHKEDGEDTFADILSICINQMMEDDFFRRTGLEKLLTQNADIGKKNRTQRRAEKKVSEK